MTIATRYYAHVLDIQLPNVEEPRGCHASSDAVGGCYGIEWYSYFQDRKTGETYKVCERDGVYGGKGAYTDDAEYYRTLIYRHLVDQFAKVPKGTPKITITLTERRIIQGFTHAFLLESEEGKLDGKQSHLGLNGGVVGFFRGIPVWCK